MYCSSCGVALAQQMKYCNRCGAQLIHTKEASAAKSLEKRLNKELDNLFWVTLIGLGLILGGMVLMRKALQLGEGLIVAYMILSSTAFAINFALGLWQVRRVARSLKEAEEPGQAGQLDTNGLAPIQSRIGIDAAPSVTESTTRNLEPMPKEQVT